MANSNKGYGCDPDVSNPKVTWDLSLSDDQTRMLKILGDIILPQDARSKKASDVPGVVDFVNEWLSAPYEEQQGDRALVLKGMEYLNSKAGQIANKPFYDLSPQEQMQLFSRLADPGQLNNEEQYLHTFFNRLVRIFVCGFYTTAEGMDDIGYVGNKFMQTFEADKKIVADLGL